VIPSPLREATAPDASAIAAVVNAAFEVERFFVEGSRTNVNEVLEYMRKGRFLVTEGGGRMTGCVYFEARGASGYFGLLAVHPGEKGQGLGRLMVAAVEDELRNAGCQAVDIRVVDLRTELVPFYRRLGYEKTGTEPFPTPTKRPCHFIRMSKALTASPA
jgi:predicted N-acetyltransferase YhbS